MTTPRKTSTDRPATQKTPQGRTQPAQADGPVPRLPHERDESDDSQTRAAESQHDVGQQAFEDVESGQTDTGRLPVTDRTYDRLKKSDR